MGASASVENVYSKLEKQDAETTSALIEQLGSDAAFLELASFEADGIAKRDEEDAVKLQAGIQVSIDNQVLEALSEPPVYTPVDVVGKTPDEVCSEILEHVGAAAETGCVIVLCGLSGTGKGTTVDRLKQRLPNAITWSNGNVFRSLTLLAVTHWEQKPDGGSDFDAEQALTPELLNDLMAMLHFEKMDHGWDIRIDGLGLNLMVSEVKNTLLKSPKVSASIPSVAMKTQGHVVKFTAHATDLMRADGCNVILEGREATVNFVPTPYRYTLVMSDTSLIGKRRAAQRIAASALDRLSTGGHSPEEVAEAVKGSLSQLHAGAISPPVTTATSES